jgi:hypothetical protein
MENPIHAPKGIKARMNVVNEASCIADFQRVPAILFRKGKSLRGWPNFPGKGMGEGEDPGRRWRKGIDSVRLAYYILSV